jgi:two-component system, LytTR family, sensor kinase
VKNFQGNARIPAWRNGRIWFAVWLVGAVILLAILAADAWPWLEGSPRAGFRNTKLFLWPLETLWWLLVPGIFWLQKNLTLVDRRWPWAVALHGLMAALITGLFIVLEAVRLLLANHLPAAYLPVMVDDLRWMGGWSYTPALDYLLLIFGLYALNFYREWQAGQRLTGELQVANAQLETRLVRASLDALKMQLHPHFLFNTLNSITSLIRNNRTREAEDVVAGLGELLRRSLDHRQEAKETLEHELVFLQRYLAIESIRFQDRLRVEFDIAPKCLPALVPGLILQPLVENAMKHGISRDPAARLLRISAARDGTRLLLTVYNDGPPLPREDAALSQGIGVQNTLTRLQMLYGDEAHLWLRDQAPHGVRAEIILPFQPHSP